MIAREFDPFSLDVTAFAKAAAELSGHWPLMQFDRLIETAVADAPALGAVQVRWSARGERRTLRGGEAQIWLHLSASTGLPLECQRCLKAVDVSLQAQRGFLFVHGEDAAAQLDAQSDDDVLALTRALDLRELMEDELLLVLPLVPRHEVCPVPLTFQAAAAAAAEPAKPFAVLAALKRPGPLS